MQIVADLEVHSKYARAVSPQMTLPTIAAWADKKGIDLVGTGDFTHPLWEKELENQLEEAEEGIFRLKNGRSIAKFLLTSEISCVYSHLGKVRRVHMLVFLPTFATVRQFNSRLQSRGAKLLADGRPTVGLSLAQVAQMALEVDKDALLVPAHVWTPWFGFYGANGGYDSLTQAYGDLAKYIPAVETGMSSDPAMNWRIAELDKRQIVSFGDAHSPLNLGRETTTFELTKLSYSTLTDAFWGRGGQKVGYTIEFYPEEGKYHYTGHRNCKVVHSPKDSKQKGLICPVCGRRLTVGVMHRVEELASRPEIIPKRKTDGLGVCWYQHPSGKRPDFIRLVPLDEILAEAYQVGAGSVRVLKGYEGLVSHFGSELAVLLRTPLAEISHTVGERVARAVAKVRKGDITINPGYDGIYGTVKIWPGETASPATQQSLF